MADEIHRLIVQAVGDEEMMKLQRGLDTARAALESAAQVAIARFGPAMAQVDASVVAAAQRVNAWQNSIKALESDLARSGGHVAGLTQSITTYGYVLNDVDQFNVSFSAGIRSISNNIPGLVFATQNLANVGFAGITTALMGPAGIIIGLTALGSLIPFVSNHWASWSQVLGLGRTETEAEAMDKLGKATSKTADETDRLNRYKRVQTTVAALETGESKEESSARRALQEAVPELPGGFEGLREALVSARNPKGLAGRFTLEDEQKLAAMRLGQNLPGAPGLGGPEGEKFIRDFEAQATERARQAERDRATRDIGEGIADPQRRQGFLNELRNTGQNESAIALEEAVSKASPEKKKAEEVAERIEKVSETLSKALDKAKGTIDKKAKELREEDFALSRAIQEVEESDRKDAEKERKKQEKEEKDAAKEQEQSGRAIGLGDIAKQAALGGAGAGEVEDYLRKRFGLGAEAAGQIALKGSQEASKQLLDETLNPKRRPSEITSDIHADIQRGVEGDDKQERAIRVAEEMRNGIREVAQNTKKSYADIVRLRRRNF
jgi:hypothetical protein